MLFPSRFVSAFIASLQDEAGGFRVCDIKETDWVFHCGKEITLWNTAHPGVTTASQNRLQNELQGAAVVVVTGWICQVTSSGNELFKFLGAWFSCVQRCTCKNACLFAAVNNS